VLAKTIRTWKLWDGSKLAQGPDLSSEMPVLRLEPAIGPQTWWSPDAHIGPLMIRVNYSIQTRYVEDVLNLWEAIENALYPYGRWDEQERMRMALVECGSDTGQWEFAMPASDPNPRETEDGIFHCIGMMRISVVRGFNP
jgi:hypothetical protein